MQRRVEAENMLRQTQKMEAIGHLTGGTRTISITCSRVIIREPRYRIAPLGQRRRRNRKVFGGCPRGWTSGLLIDPKNAGVRRQQPLEPQSVDGNKLVSGMSELLRRSLGETLKLETVLAGGLWRTNVDRNQLENAILNLVVNARDAMSANGRLTIETANAHLDDKYAARHGVPAGQYVLVAVTDTGTGMIADVIEKAFDPFFTTKKGGEGTGLGLSQVYGFVKQSGGHVKIYSEVGQGTTIILDLPRYFGPTLRKTRGVKSLRFPHNDGSATILVV